MVLSLFGGPAFTAGAQETTVTWDEDFISSIDVNSFDSRNNSMGGVVVTVAGSASIRGAMWEANASPVIIYCLDPAYLITGIVISGMVVDTSSCSDGRWNDEGVWSGAADVVTCSSDLARNQRYLRRPR